MDFTGCQAAEGQAAPQCGSLLASSLLDSGMNMDMGVNLSSGQASLYLDWFPIPAVLCAVVLVTALLLLGGGCGWSGGG